MHRISRTSVCLGLALLFMLVGRGMAQELQPSDPQPSQEGPRAAGTESPTPEPMMRPRHHRMAHGRWMGIGATGLRHMERLAQQLGLSDDQRTQVQSLQLNYAKEAIRTRADMAEAHVEVRQLLNADQPDLSQVKDKLQQIASKEAQLRFAHITMIQNIRKLLTPEQQKQWRAMRARKMSYSQRER
jgi:Spy/CpxP family protein refolding chaperone